LAEEKPEVSSRHYENTIKQIRDVIASRVVLNDKGELEEIHVLAGPGRSPKHIVRDIESAIIAAFGVRVDRRKISVAQINSNETVKAERRVKLMRIALVAATNSAQVEVLLTMGDTQASGSASGVPTPKTWLRLAAQATVCALTKLISSKYKLLLDNVTVTQSANVKIVLVSLVLVGARNEKILSGSCPVTYDEREATVKATLDAVNRKFSLLADDGGR